MKVGKVKSMMAVPAIAITALTVMALDCGDSSHDVPTDNTTRLITVQMVNDVGNDQPIHILGPNEDFGAANRLEPGQERV